MMSTYIARYHLQKASMRFPPKHLGKKLVGECNFHTQFRTFLVNNGYDLNLQQVSK